MISVQTPVSPSVSPYIALHYQHFPVEIFTDQNADMVPFWSGEGNLSYLVVNRDSREAFLIDPDLEILGSYLLTLNREALRLVAVIDTHTHAEHATAGPVLNQLFKIPYLMHHKAPASAVTERILEDSERTIAGIQVGMMHTPGHTPDLMTLQIGEHLFTGDSLFNQSSGRTDLPGGNAHQQYQSIHKIAEFPAHFRLHPGHDYNHQLSLSIAEVRAQNSRLGIAEPDAFAALMKTHYASQEKPDDLAYYLNVNTQ
ncbi:MBL fold metallo-hydrolase [Vampirovibrio sp.]|uniref:MBL fold metallo-hydrolase n=1 Tax=Vampirovibrio sp. TaxID=2717857 RepID=UPI00359416DE